MADATSVVLRGIVAVGLNDKIVLVDCKNLTATDDTISASLFVPNLLDGVSALKSAFCFNATTGVQKGATIAATQVTLTATNGGTLTAWLWFGNDLGAGKT